MNDTIFYSHSEFNTDIKQLVKQLEGKQFDVIVGINRGGCIPAVCLSHALKTPCTMIDFSTRDGINFHPRSLFTYFEELSQQCPKILIVDDLIDSGKAMKALLPIVKCYTQPSLAVLLYNTDVVLDIETYYGTAFSRKAEPRYFDFFWEMYGH